MGTSVVTCDGVSIWCGGDGVSIWCGVDGVSIWCGGDDVSIWCGGDGVSFLNAGGFDFTSYCMQQRNVEDSTSHQEKGGGAEEI